MSSAIGSSNLHLDSALMLLLSEISKRPKSQQAEVMQALLSPSKNERDKDIDRKRSERSESARIIIPECKNPSRRAACLVDPERFLRTYFGSRYSLAFGKDHLFMIETITNRARNGGRQAVAAPRGRGKSELCKGLLVYLVLAELVRFILPVAATTPLAKRLYRDFRKKLATNDLLLADFPEVCQPIRELAGAPLRAHKQHVNGQLTNIVWTDDYLSLPIVPGSPYGGVKMAYYGLDSAFRGANIDGDRPDFVLIDDPETRESAKSVMQIDDREAIIDQDISGLASQEEHLAIVVLSTVQNNFCLSARLTDPKRKPAYNGKRFGMVVSWPTKMELWQDYIAARHASQVAGDEHGRKAVALYLANRAEMDEGVEMISDHFKPVEIDGEELVFSAIQQAFNQIADTSMEAYQTEYQNSPPEEESIERNNLTAARVQSRIGKHTQRECSSTTELRTVGIDIGNRQSHWIDSAWEGNAIGSIVDYGIMETHQIHEADDKAVELAILASLEIWAEEVVAKINPLLVLIDSGSGRGHTQAVYEFCRRHGAPFFPSKGWSDQRFRLPDRVEGSKEPFLETYAHKLEQEQVWLYNVNTEWWKRWLQQRFLTTPFDGAGNRVDGSLVLFNPGDDKKRHLSIAHHMTAEEEQLVPVFGKESKRVWFVKNRNNHWLDAGALACAAAGAVGVRLIEAPKPITVVTEKQPATKPLTDQYGRSFVATRR